MSDSNRRSLQDWLADIIVWGDKVEFYIGNMTFEEFVMDGKTKDAVTKCLEVVGEAAQRILQLEPDFEARHPELQLRAAYRARNRTIHGYHSVDIAALWRSATVSCPEMIRYVKRIQAEG